ncbi:MAG: helix-hairpin-helix domain-containing protein [Devosia sp.]
MSWRAGKAGADGPASLRNIGPAMLADFKLLGIGTVAQLAEEDADALYLRLCKLTDARQDPCVHDTFAAAIHQARTGEALAWWDFTTARKARVKSGSLTL